MHCKLVEKVSTPFKNIWIKKIVCNLEIKGNIHNESIPSKGRVELYPLENNTTMEDSHEGNKVEIS